MAANYVLITAEALRLMLNPGNPDAIVGVAQAVRPAIQQSMPYYREVARELGDRCLAAHEEEERRKMQDPPVDPEDLALIADFVRRNKDYMLSTSPDAPSQIGDPKQGSWFCEYRKRFPIGKGGVEVLFEDSNLNGKLDVEPPVDYEGGQDYVRFISPARHPLSIRVKGEENLCRAESIVFRVSGSGTIDGITEYGRQIWWNGSRHGTDWDGEKKVFEDEGEARRPASQWESEDIERRGGGPLAFECREIAKSVADYIRKIQGGSKRGQYKAPQNTAPRR